MKKIKILIGIILLSNIVWSQTETTSIVYTYDAAGSRIKRELVVEKIKKDTLKNKGDSLIYTSEGESRKIGDSSTVEKQMELVQKYGLDVYPNPTEGKLNLVITNYTNNLKGEIRLYHQTGSLLWTQKSISSNNIIDLSNRPTGTYILELFIENKGVQWKIIKN